MASAARITMRQFLVLEFPLRVNADSNGAEFYAALR
jgi:hypothetical protein